MVVAEAQKIERKEMFGWAGRASDNVPSQQKGLLE